MIDVDTTLQQATDILKFTAGFVEDDSKIRDELHRRDLAHAAFLMDKLIYRRGPVMQLTIGEKPVDAFGVRKNAYDFLEHRVEEVEPGYVENLRFIHRISTDHFDRTPQPIYGHIRYFSLKAIGTTLREGGSLTLAEEE